MPAIDPGDWLDEQMEAPEAFWYVKRLSANDTQANGAHQAGFYIPRQVAFHVIPSLRQPAEENPRVRFGLTIDSHSDARTVTAIWYNNQLRGGTRNETRVTGLGGSSSALLDPEATGALAVFAFRRETQTDPPTCRVWVCDYAVQEDRIEDVIGPVEPGQGRTWPDLFTPPRRRADCWLDPDDIPPTWLDQFPTGDEMVRRSIEMRPDLSAELVDVDTRLTGRRTCEENIFYSIEDAREFPQVSVGYGSMNAFVDHAQSVLQRRKSRAGRSLELQVRHILREEDLVEDRHFSYQAVSERNRKPDFLFPNAAAYRDPNFPQRRLRMLAVKTTLKDRWRQVIEEADRIEIKHLLTLQEGVSERQFLAIEQAGVQLVVPASLHEKYRAPLRSSLMTLESFIGEVGALAS